MKRQTYTPRRETPADQGIAAVRKERAALAEKAKALLARLENLTTDQFSKGGERKEREELRAALREMGEL
jgi:hypothetical protein